MAKWLYRKPKLSQLAKQVADVTTSLAAAIHVLQGVQNFNLSSARMDMLLAQIETLHQASRTGSKHNVPMSLDSPLQDSASRPKDSSDAGVFRNNGPYLAMDVGSRSSSTESFRTARSGHEASPETISSPANVLSSERTLATKVGCERFCQCQCHSSNRLRTPTWTTRLFGSMNFHGNGSILLNRRACNRTFCRRSGCLRVQVSYIAPAWLKAFIVYTKAESLGGIAPSYSIIMPRVIPFSAVVWSMVELGKIPELRELFAHRLASPYDVGVDGVSLLKYAALKGQNEVYHFLLTQNADPYLRDHSGM
ncbi:hypothetical protein GQ44DRAFT_703779 [Phaeosphaeriaceae sp. PMI808]|nr:hypothetical protein GQ44DRAFT_703779 [Phaeosphaeriaceae sp. PMI808]